MNCSCDAFGSVGAPQHSAPAPASPSLLGPPSLRRWRAGRRRLPLLPRLRTPLLLRLLGQLCEPRWTGQSHEPLYRKRTVSAGETTSLNTVCVFELLKFRHVAQSIKQQAVLQKKNCCCLTCINNSLNIQEENVTLFCENSTIPKINHSWAFPFKWKKSYWINLF